MIWLQRFYLWRVRRRDREIISQSGQFDPNYYLKANPDAVEAAIDPLRHYLQKGRLEGRAPSPHFDPRVYLDSNPDVAASGLDPFVHYIRHGRLEGRPARSHRQIIESSGLFDPAYYRALYPDVPLSADPLRHYLESGRPETRRPSLDFDPAVYLSHSPDVKNKKLNPLVHYIEHGRAEARECRRPGIDRKGLAAIVEHVRATSLFDDSFYLRQCPAVRQAGVNPLLHYLVGGCAQFTDPSLGFSTREYILANSEVGISGTNPLLHYLDYDYDANLSGTAPSRALRTEAAATEIKAGEAYFQRYGFSFDPAESPGSFTVDAIVELVLRSPALRIERIEPDVTIIVPVYGQLHFVLNCLDSLSRQRSRFSVEILVTDDASPAAAQTARLGAIPWIRYSPRGSNAGFLDNCNHAAQKARGRFLVFLNSDTRVTDGWLDELVGSFEVFPKAGLAGSTFFNPDGTLQEAGGILWRDGSAWNYGHNDDPNHPRYCFARQADYISGASIAVPTKVWRLMDGFDTAYRPAYYEDADLALRLRKAGYEVWLQPLSRVIHYEGKTHGRDLSKGVKRHQKINARRLLDSWRDILSAHRPNGEDVHREANRRVQNRILVLDATTPAPDRDSGSFITFRMLKALQVLGYQVTFVPQHNYVHQKKYTADLERLGIECLYSPYFCNISDVFNYRDDFDVVLAYRFNVLNKVYEEIRSRLPTARIIFHNVDLHFLREEREAALHAGRHKKIAAAITKASELELIAKVDCTVVHTKVEAAIIKKFVAVDNIVEFPYIAELHRTKVDFDDRHDVLFLGGLNHPPNSDAVTHFATAVWPTLARRLPKNAQFLIVGSHAGADIRALEGPRIVVTGYVEDLLPYFERARVFVAPLRYGAGIKGKVIQSLCYGTPSVVSSIAAEGIGLVSGRETVIADDDATFIEQVLAVYSDRALWYSAQSAGYEFAEGNFSWARCLELLSKVLDTADAHWLSRHERTLQKRLKGLLAESQEQSYIGDFYSPVVDPEEPYMAAALEKFDAIELPEHSAVSAHE